MGCLLRIAEMVITALVQLVIALAGLIVSVVVPLFIRLFTFAFLATTTGATGILGGESTVERMAEDVMVRLRIPAEYKEEVKNGVWVFFVVLTVAGLVLLIALGLPIIRAVLAVLPYIQIFL